MGEAEGRSLVSSCRVSGAAGKAIAKREGKRKKRDPSSRRAPTLEKQRRTPLEENHSADIEERSKGWGGYYQRSWGERKLEGIEMFRRGGKSRKCSRKEKGQ